MAISGWASLNFEAQFRKDALTHLQRTNTLQTAILTDVDIQFLPQPVQKYLRYTGVINQPKLNNVDTVLAVEQIARITGLRTLELDQVFVNYGAGYYNRTEGKYVD